MGLSVSTNFSQGTKDILGKLVLGGRLLENKEVKIYSGIKKDLNVQVGYVTPTLKAITDCDFTSNADVNISSKLLSPIEVGMDLEFCKSKYNELWSASDAAPGIGNFEVKTLNDFILANAAPGISKQIEKAMFMGGVSGVTGSIYEDIDGFVTILDGVSGETVVAATGSALSESNIIAELIKVYQAIPDAVLNYPGTAGNDDAGAVIFVTPKVFRLYKIALGNLSLLNGALTVDAVTNTPKPYSLNFHIDGRVRIMESSLEISGDKLMLAGNKNNFILGTDKDSDYNEVSMFDLSQVNGEDKMRFKVRFKLGFQIAFPDQVVIYKTVA